MYDPKSKHAEDFINHEEIMETLDYARKNKTNRELIGEILEKAKKRKGLSHREAAVLLDCELDDKNQEIFTLAEQIKKDFYNRIAMFAPLYLSNYCANGCSTVHIILKTSIARKKLTVMKFARSADGASGYGAQEAGYETGEDPVNCPIEYTESIKTIYDMKHKNGRIRQM